MMSEVKNKRAVLISCFDWYDTRLKPIRDILIEMGYEVTVLTSDYDHIRKEPVIKKNDKCTYIHVKRYKKNISFNRLESHYKFSKAVFRKILTIQPDLLYALIPPNSVANICRQYKIRYPNVKLVFDIIDMWPESMPGEKLHRTLPFLYWKNLRDKSLRHADHIFTECNLYRDRFNTDTKKISSTLYLFKNANTVIGDISANTEVGMIYKQKLILCYLGSINSIIDINGICCVVGSLCKSYNVEVRVIGKGESKDKFLEMLNKTGAKIKYYGAIFDDYEKANILCECDYAFNMMIESVKVGLSIKSIDYLSYGIPLINNLKGDTWDIIEKEKIGINISQDTVISRLPSIDRKRVLNVYNAYFSEEAFRLVVKKELEKIIYD